MNEALRARSEGLRHKFDEPRERSNGTVKEKMNDTLNQKFYNEGVSAAISMVRVNELPPKTAQETYEIFKDLREGFRSEEFNFVLFYGNPTDTEISWCPDCRTVHVDFIRFAKDYKGTARFHTVPIGSREEFNKDNPFLRNVPQLDAVPTLVIYRELIVYLKLVDPTFEDIAYFAKKYKL